MVTIIECACACTVDLCTRSVGKELLRMRAMTKRRRDELVWCSKHVITDRTDNLDQIEITGDNWIIPADSTPMHSIYSLQIHLLVRPKSVSVSPISPSPKSESESNIQQESAAVTF